MRRDTTRKALISFETVYFGGIRLGLGGTSSASIVRVTLRVIFQFGVPVTRTARLGIRAIVRLLS